MKGAGTVIAADEDWGILRSLAFIAFAIFIAGKSVVLGPALFS
jgi:hypothetical protein